MKNPALTNIIEWAARRISKLAASFRTKRTQRQITQVTTAADAMLARLQRPSRGRT